jgi:hypothetical protein
MGIELTKIGLTNIKLANTESTSNDVWLTNHPYLSRIADLQHLVDEVLGELSIPTVGIPPWDLYASDFDAGIPLLLSPDVGIDLSPVERSFASFLERLSLKPLPDNLALQVTDLIADLHADSEFSSRVIAWLLRR